MRSVGIELPPGYEVRKYRPHNFLHVQTHSRDAGPLARFVVEYLKVVVGFAPSEHLTASFDS
jgi:hypothetical protein